MLSPNQAEATSTTDNMPKHYHPRRTVLKMVFGALALTALVIGVVTGVKRRSRNQDSESSLSAVESPQQQMVEHLLPFLQVTVTEESQDKVLGTMDVVQDREHFAFASEQTDFGNEITLSFVCDKEMATQTDEMDGWCGFDMTILQDTSIDITLLRYDDQPDKTVRISDDPNDELSSVSQMALESFLASKTSEYFVGLTFKLGAMGKSGAGHHVYGILHAHAKWIVSVVIHDENIQANWDLGDALSDTSGRRRLGIHETSIAAEINELYLGPPSGTAETQPMNNEPVSKQDLDQDLPDFMKIPSHHRRHLGSCGSPINACGNRCFGMCGPDCTCWAWACGGCGCYDGCFLHDYFCSCVSFWSFQCLFAVYALVC